MITVQSVVIWLNKKAFWFNNKLKWVTKYLFLPMIIVNFLLGLIVDWNQTEVVSKNQGHFLWFLLLFTWWIASQTKFFNKINDVKELE